MKVDEQQQTSSDKQKRKRVAIEVPRAKTSLDTSRRSHTPDVRLVRANSVLAGNNHKSKEQRQGEKRSSSTITRNRSTSDVFITNPRPRTTSRNEDVSTRQANLTLLAAPKHRTEAVRSVQQIMSRKASVRAAYSTIKKPKNQKRPATSAGVYDLDARQRENMLYDKSNTYMSYEEEARGTNLLQESINKSAELYSSFNKLTTPRSTVVEDTSELDLQIPFSKNTVKTDTRRNYISGFTFGLNNVVGGWVESLESNKEQPFDELIEEQRKRSIQATVKNNMRYNGLSPEPGAVSQLSQKILILEERRLSTPDYRASSSRSTTRPMSSTSYMSSVVDDDLETPRTELNEIPENHGVEVAELARKKLNQFKNIYHPASYKERKHHYDRRSDEHNGNDEDKKLHDSEGQERSMSTMKQLREKIDDLRQSAWKMKDFQKRIQQYKEEDRQKRIELQKNQKDFVKNQIHTVTKEDYTRESIITQKQEELAKKREKQETAYDRKRELDQAHLIKTTEEFLAREEKRERAMSAKELIPQRKKLEKKLRLLLPMVLLAAFVSRLDSIMYILAKNRWRIAQERRAIRILRTKFYPILLCRRERKIEEAKQVILRQKLFWIINYRIRKKHKATAIVKQFLFDFKECTTIVQRVLAYVQKVKRCQRLVVRHLQSRQCQVELLSKQWDAVERKVAFRQNQQDLEELKTKVIDELHNLNKATLSIDASSRTRHRSTKANMKRGSKTTLDAKKTLRSAKEIIVQELKASNIPLYKSTKKGPADVSVLISTIQHTPVLKMQDLLVKCGETVNVFIKKRLSKTDEKIKINLIRTDMKRRLDQHWAMVKMKEQEKKALLRSKKTDEDSETKSVIEEPTAPSPIIFDNYRNSKPWFKHLMAEHELEKLILQGLELTMIEIQQQAENLRMERDLAEDI